VVQQEGKLIHGEVVILVDVQLQEDSEGEILRVVFFELDVLAEEIFELFEGNCSVGVGVGDEGVIVDGSVLVGIVVVGFVAAGEEAKHEDDEQG
jgi:hypothetical protein